MIFARFYRPRSSVAKGIDQESRSARTTVFVLGDSHTNAIKAAAETSAIELPFDLKVINVRELRPQAGVNALVDTASGESTLHPVLKRLISPVGPTLFLSSFGGNTHNVFGLINHPEPFDFILPSDPGLPLQSDATLVPYDVLKDAIMPFALASLTEISALRNTYAGYVGHLESPPPNGDDAYVRKFLDPYFKDKAKDQGIASRHLRFKLWRMHSEIVLEHCKSHNVDFLPVPDDSRDQDGFLVPQGYSISATHANPWYGSLVIAQISALVSRVRN